MEILTKIKNFINELIKFIKDIPDYYKLHQWYGYKPLKYDFIIYHYETVLNKRTKGIDILKCHWEDVLDSLDEYYKELYKEKMNLLETEIKRLEKKNG